MRAPVSATSQPAEASGLPTEASGLRPGGSGSFKVTEQGIWWICASCETENPLAQQNCVVCGASFADTVGEKPEERPQRDPGTAALLSLALPGAGHWYVGLKGQAVARAILSSWVVMVVIVVGIQRSVPGSIGIALVYGLAAFGLWFAAAHDAYREARSESSKVVLKGKLWVYVVLGLLGVLFVAIMGAAMLANR